MSAAGVLLPAGQKIRVKSFERGIALAALLGHGRCKGEDGCIILTRPVRIVGTAFVARGSSHHATMRALRKRFRISRTELARMIGMSGESLGAREYGRAPWKESELRELKRTLEKHLSDASQALQEAFPTQP